MTLPSTKPLVAIPVISPSPSIKRRGSKSPPRYRSKRLRKPSVHPHSPSTDSQKSAEVELPPPGPRGSAKSTPTSSKSSQKGLVVQTGSHNIPSSPFLLEVEDESVSSPGQHSITPMPISYSAYPSLVAESPLFGTSLICRIPYSASLSPFRQFSFLPIAPLSVRSFMSNPLDLTYFLIPNNLLTMGMEASFFEKIYTWSKCD
ncbi:hypothetical protein L6452_33241 [Arctium lappa]|uniref:Uncharacterized protein n=1 Tax=Arctium lappa TaxID=4217 RepID=A0ACB8Z7G0_ARCLA|nr:hypothetical protein L6452_33241 [Arctium lappa]